MTDPGRLRDVTGLTTPELDRARRELAASLALSRPGSPARAIIAAHITAVGHRTCPEARRECGRPRAGPWTRRRQSAPGVRDGTGRGPVVVSLMVLSWVAAVLCVADCLAPAAGLVARQGEHERLCGPGCGRLRIHRLVWRRVPGLPRDGRRTSGEEAVIRDIERRKGGTA